VAQRRAKGERGIYCRKDGRWAGQYLLETATGYGRRYVYGKTRKDVAEKLRQALANRDKGLVFNSENITDPQEATKWEVH
jgi:integrase